LTLGDGFDWSCLIFEAFSIYVTQVSLSLSLWDALIHRIYGTFSFVSPFPVGGFRSRWLKVSLRVVSPAQIFVEPGNKTKIWSGANGGFLVLFKRPARGFS
jgi:hypothetical protein